MFRKLTVRNRRTFLLALVAFAAIGGALLTAGRSSAAAPAFVFRGGGWGHGVGMSQFGAYGMALRDGATSAEILAHYYRGTSLSVLGEDLPAAEPLWVNLESEVTRVVLHAWPRVTGAVPVTVTRGDESLTVAPGTAVTISVAGVDEAGTPRCTVEADSGILEAGPCDLDLEWDGWEDLPSTVVTVDRTWSDLGFTRSAACTLADWNTSPPTNRPCTYGRGTLHVRPDDSTTSFHLVVEIDVDDYVLGISEMPYYWALPVDGPNGFAALEAQAIAARSYALHRQAVRGDPEERPWCWCHVYDTTADQRYVGWGHAGTGLDRWIDAVQGTDGVVLTHPADQRHGLLIPAETFYGSSTFGHTESSASGFGISSPYLVSVDDAGALLPGLGNAYTSWEAVFSPEALAARLGWPQGTAVESLEVLSCTSSGAIDQIRFTGSGRSDVKRARSLRSLLGLRSPQITNAGAPPPAIPPCPGLDTGRIPFVAGVVRIDDDDRDDSIGNGDGVAACGERVEVFLDLAVIQAGGLHGITASYAAVDPVLELAFNAATGYPDIPWGGTAAGRDDWDVRVAPDAPDGTVARFEVVVTAAEGGPWRIPVEFPVACPAAATTTTATTTTLAPTTTTTAPTSTTSAATATTTTVAPAAGPVLSVLAVDDNAYGDSRGNDDHVAACGEIVELRALVRNDGPTAMTGWTATFASDDPYLSLRYNADSAYPDIAPGAAAVNRNDWDVAIAAAAPDGHRAAITLDLASPQGETHRFSAVLPVSCTAPAPVLAGVTIDDGPHGDSQGNDDRAAQCGELIEVFASLRNDGSAALTGLEATLATADPYLTLLYNAASAYPDLDAGTAAANTADWDFSVAESVPAGHVATAVLTITADRGGPWEVPLEFPLSCDLPPVSITALTVDDGVRGDSVGDLDRTAECGETIELYAELGNATAADLTGVSVEFSTADRYLALLYNERSAYPAIPAGGTGENRDDWDIRIDREAPPGHRAAFSLTVTADQGTWTVPGNLPLACSP